MNLHNTLASIELNTIQTIAGKGVYEGKPAKETDAGWPLGICRSNSTGELIVIDYHFHMIANDGIFFLPGKLGAYSDTHTKSDINAIAKSTDQYLTTFKK